MGYKRKETKAKINWGWDAPENRKGKATRSVKKTQKNVNSTLKKVGFKGILIALCVLVVFVAIGGGACYFLTKDDCFKLNGNANVEFSVETPYIEEGFTVIEFGRDVSSKVEIETNMIVDENGNYTPQYDELGNPIIGQYYIIYRAKTFKYSKFSTIERIRFVTFNDILEN